MSRQGFGAVASDGANDFYCKRGPKPRQGRDSKAKGKERSDAALVSQRRYQKPCKGGTTVERLFHT